MSIRRMHGLSRPNTPSAFHVNAAHETTNSPTPQRPTAANQRGWVVAEYRSPCRFVPAASRLSWCVLSRRVCAVSHAAAPSSMPPSSLFQVQVSHGDARRGEVPHQQPNEQRVHSEHSRPTPLVAVQISKSINQSINQSIDR